MEQDPLIGLGDIPNVTDFLGTYLFNVSQCDDLTLGGRQGFYGFLNLGTGFFREKKSLRGLVFPGIRLRYPVIDKIPAFEKPIWIDSGAV
jgi:hypothetical protein